MKSSKKVQQIIKNPNTALAIWSGKSFTDPYVVLQSRADVHEDLETKKKYWNLEWMLISRILRTQLCCFKILTSKN